MGRPEKISDFQIDKARTVGINARATQEVRAAFEWYDDRQPGIGQRFNLEFEICLNKIKANPFAFSIYHRRFRRVTINHFPYKVYFAVKRDLIVIIAVIHSARSNRFLKKRLRI